MSIIEVNYQGQGGAGQCAAQMAVEGARHLLLFCVHSFEDAAVEGSACMADGRGLETAPKQR
jgi:hypothetical protein